MFGGASDHYCLSQTLLSVRGIDNMSLLIRNIVSSSHASSVVSSLHLCGALSSIRSWASRDRHVRHLGGSPGHANPREEEHPSLEAVKPLPVAEGVHHNDGNCLTEEVSKDCSYQYFGTVGTLRRNQTQVKLAWRRQFPRDGAFQD